MDRYTSRISNFNTRNFLTVTLTLALIASIGSYRALQGEQTAEIQQTNTGQSHICILPQLQPDFNNVDCTSFAAQYAAALASLQQAHVAADAAYQAWYNCEMNNGPTPPAPADIPAAELSVLVD
jgi:capsule polysaccharide export protein KpsE/RkpR